MNLIWIPPNYDETKQYNVLYLMHGIGGNEMEWGMTGSLSTVKIVMDNLIGYGDIEPFIVVTPNGCSSAKNAVRGLCDKTDRLTEGKNFLWQEVKGIHDFKVWYLGFYNFAQLVFKK